MHHFVLVLSVSLLLNSIPWVICSSLPLKLVSHTPELGEAYLTCSVPKGALLPWCSLGMVFSGCVAVTWCFCSCASVQGALNAVLPVSLSLGRGYKAQPGFFLHPFCAIPGPSETNLHWPVEWGALLAAAESTVFLVFPRDSVCRGTLCSFFCHLSLGF